MLEYGEDCLEVLEVSLDANDIVLIVDDLITLVVQSQVLSSCGVLERLFWDVICN